MADHPAWCSPLSAIRDALSFATNAANLRRPAFAIIDTLQHFAPHLQLDAVFITGVAMAQALGLDPHELVARARRILPDAEGPFSSGEHIGAIRDYAKGELNR